jgi:hypothetical protein
MLYCLHKLAERCIAMSIDIGFAGLVLIVFSAPILIAVFMCSRRKALTDLDTNGIRTMARVLDVRDDANDMQTIVTYEFNGALGGNRFERSGVLRRDLPLPKSGDMIEVVYQASRPSLSRLKNEENHSFK